jgi:predicted metalloprotease with PDZ domain
MALFGSSFGSMLSPGLGSLARLAAASFLLAAAPARAEVRYEVEPNGDRSRIKVTMRFEAAPGPLELQMPNWSPGDYELKLHGKKVADLHGRDSAGTPVAFDHAADNSWKALVAKSGEVTVDYTVPAKFEEGALHYSGPGSYLYVVGRKEEPCHLTLVLPPDWKVAVGLDPEGESEIEYEAPDYDVLADNPVTAGEFVDLHYTSHGKPITIALRGALRGALEPQKIVELLQRISDVEGDFFGDLPFHKYVWHIALSPMEDGGGGLEHLSSTQIVLAKGVGPGARRVCAHEFFHLWNVKRIRPKALGPFDYTRLPRTGALWWMEGVTDYYASLLLLRSGLGSEEQFRKELADNANALLSNPARLEVSPAESSLRAGEANDGRGKGDGWRISFYNAGWLAAACLDLELRAETGGRKTLDDVERALWEICKGGPGFEEDEIEKQYLRAGGSKEFFESVVTKPGELPLDRELERVGLHLERRSIASVDKGFNCSYTSGSPDVSADDVSPFAAAAGLAANDLILEVNGRPVVGKTMQETVANMVAAIGTVRAGDKLELKVRHENVEKAVSLTAVEASRPVFSVVDAAGGDSTKLAVRRSWYSAVAK